MSEQTKKGTYLNAQKFYSTPVRSPIQPVYRAGDPDSGRNRSLVQIGERDLREVVQSGYVNSFDYILDRFLDSGGNRNDLLNGQGMPDNQNFLIDALDLNADWINMMEEARELYNLPADMSYDDIRNKLHELLEEQQKGVNSNDKIQTEEQQSRTADQTSQDVESASESPTV